MNRLAIIAMFINLCFCWEQEAFAPPPRPMQWVHISTTRCEVPTADGLAFIDISLDYAHVDDMILERTQFRGFNMDLPPGWAQLVTTEFDNLEPHTPAMPEGENINLYGWQAWPQPGETRWFGGWFGVNEPLARAYGSFTIPK